MANPGHDIDAIYRERFTGSTDHSVSPQSQWAAVESSLQAASVASAASSGIAASSGWSIAASFAAILTVSSITTQDSGKPDIVSDMLALQETERQIDQIAKTDETVKSAIEVESEFIDQHTSAETITLAEVNHNSNDIITLDEAAVLEEEDVFNSSIAAITTKRESEEWLDPMDLVDISSKTAETVSLSSGVLSSPDYVISRHGVYARGGVRAGLGESNSRIKSKLNAGAYLALGYAFRVSKNTFFSIEAGIYKRSGHGLERRQDVDISGVYASLNNSVSMEASSPFKVERSLIATEIKYVQVPVLLHVGTGPSSNASVGFYGERLMGVRNHQFMVYNTSEYVPSPEESEIVNPAAGLAMYRLGLVGGFEKSVSEKWSVDVRALIPISQPGSKSDGYKMLHQPNQSFDLQLGLKYSI